ncbi:MAG TPA: VWA domain-containing protein [Bryobacteraceae bacterium]|nr:VWA domain-containing protein [Bryobacteraceae bacterium]
MFLLNLTPLEFLAIFGAVSGLVVTLYLLSRSRKRQRVATLRFWTQAQAPVVSKQRRRIQQPLSLLLQLLSIACLLLAIGQLQWGSRDNAARDHVLLLDTSSWMATRAGNGTLLDRAKARAKAFVQALPATDRVMVVRVEGLPGPATGMDSDRRAIEKAIDDSRPGAAALDLQQAFGFAEQVRRLHATRGGEVIYIGPGRVGDGGLPVKTPSSLRVLPVESAAVDNLGLTRIGLRRSPADPELWDVFVSARNYGSAPQVVPLAVQFGGAPVGNKTLNLTPGKVEESTFRFRTKAAGWVEARLLHRDAIAEDNRALLEIPKLSTIKVAVYTNDPDALRPALRAHPQIEANFKSTAEYKPESDASVVILDRFAPQQAPKAPSIWIDPPAGSPFRVKATVTAAKIVQWRADHELASGLRAQDVRVPEAHVFTLASGDVPVAEVEAGPVVVARPSVKAVAMGFHPGRSDLRFEIVTPLLLANILRWFEPTVFRTYDLHGGSAGTVTATLDNDADLTNVQVLGEREQLPFTIDGHTVRFFAGAPQTVRIVSSGREQVHSLTLPEVAATQWDAPQASLRGVPGAVERAVSRDLWRYLAILGAAGLLLEWLLYGRQRRRMAMVRGADPEPVAMRQAS